MNEKQSARLAMGILLCPCTLPSLAVDVLTKPSLLIRPDHRVEDAALSPDGTRVVVVGRTYGSGSGHFALAQVTLWDAVTGEMTSILTQHGDDFGAGGWMQTAFSPAGDRVLVDGYLNEVTCEDGSGWEGFGLWTVSVSQGGLEHLFEDHCVFGGRILGWAWSPDGSRIATLVDEWPSEEGTADRIRIWDAATGEMQLTFMVPEVAYPRQPTWLLTAGKIATPNSDGRIRLWDAATGQIAGFINGPFEGRSTPTVAISLDGSRAADIVPRDLPYEGHPRIWDLQEETWQLVDYLHHQPSVYGMHFSRDGRFLLASVDSPAITRNPVDVWLFDALTGKALAKLESAGDLPSQSSFSDDARRALTLSSEGVAVWDLSDVLAKPRMSIGETGPEIRWYLGTLQFAPTIDGPWSDLPAASPFPLSPIGDKGFIRVKVEWER